eukprot:GHVS01000849.1.p1 GENE.GHVS01000849.1~~GHVS01000849.1.p1  ORF type:complete len:116 (+),score=11.95 GHVS01000849.1:395-742(+)
MYAKFSLKVFWAIGLLFVSPMTLPVSNHNNWQLEIVTVFLPRPVELVQFPPKMAEEELQARPTKPPLSTYSLGVEDLKGFRLHTPTPVLGYLDDLQHKMNLSLGQNYWLNVFYTM